MPRLLASELSSINQPYYSVIGREHVPVSFKSFSKSLPPASQSWLSVSKVLANWRECIARANWIGGCTTSMSVEVLADPLDRGLPPLTPTKFTGALAIPCLKDELTIQPAWTS